MAHECQDPREFFVEWVSCLDWRGMAEEAERKARERDSE